MADLDLIIERVLTVALVIAPVAFALVTLLGVTARVFGDSSAVSSSGATGRRIPEEDPAPRWRPELARAASHDGVGGRGR